MKKFIGRIKNICEENKKVAMFIDMDGTINEYNVYSDSAVVKAMEENYIGIEPVNNVIEGLQEINKIPNIDLYILTLSKSNKISEGKKIWLDKYVSFIPKKNWIILTKENGDYSRENRDQIKPMKMQEKANEYDHLILLDDDHKILKETKSMFGNKADAFHVTSAII